ncbi:MAG: ECF-type riboflavin transporter substrate-binding protein [Ruminiclostridium sp.]
MSEQKTNKSGIPVKTIVAVGIGAALFVVLTQVSIPVGFIPNTRIQFNAALVALIGAIFGPIAGFLTAFIGHFLGDAIFYNVWWSWVIADAVYGLLVGITFKKLKLTEGGFGIKEAVIFNITQIIANAVAWIVVAPLLDIFIYAEPSNKVFAQGLTAFGTNAVVTLIVGTILAFTYSKVRTGNSSLKREA